MLCAFLFSCKPTPDGGEEGGQTTNNDLKEYVDLCLPSGTLWATCNVGASSPEEFGKYYAWGEITTKDTYTKENSLTYGKKMNDISANPKFDAATANWGKDWRMPTLAEMRELYYECTWVRRECNGVNGYKVVGPDGNSIFLPAAGIYEDSTLVVAGFEGVYWASTPYYSEYSHYYPDEAAYVGGFSLGEGFDYGPGARYDGVSVRAVRAEGFELHPQYAWVTTSAVTEKTDDYVTCVGEVTADNGLSVTTRGVCWSTKGTPTINDNYTINGSGLGSYTARVDISNLSLYTPCYIRAYATNSAGTSYGKQICVMKSGKSSGEYNGHEYVDLGLSVKWATCNVGATSPEEYGDYFAWGETSTKETYGDDNCPTYRLSISQLQSQGYIDSEGNLTSQYDAATANWGGDWRMPTYDELNELITQCTWTWMGNGYKVTGPNGSSIFLPAAGYRSGSWLDGAGSRGFYRSSAPNEEYCEEYNEGYACSLLIESYDHYMSHYYDRYFGQSVRSILE